MGFRVGKLWWGLVARDMDKKMEKPIAKSKKLSNRGGPMVSKLFGREKKVPNVDSQLNESMPSSSQEPLGQDISSTTSTTPNEISSIDNLESLPPINLEKASEGKESLKIEADEGHEDAKTVTDIGQTNVRKRPNLRQLFIAQNPVLPHWLRPRRLRASTEIEFEYLESLETQDESLDRASIKSKNDVAWKDVVATMEMFHEGELMDLREEIEALKAKSKADLDAANSKKVVLQKRVKKLLDEKSAMDLRQENVRLSNLVASLSSKNEESDETLEYTERQKQELENQLANSLDKTHFIAQNLQKVRQEADNYRNRMNQLSYALEQQPGKYVDLDREIRLRDQRYSDLELRAGECFSAMSELEKKCTEGHEADCAKIAELTIRLQKQDADILTLKASKATFQRHSEEVIGMLAGRVLPSSLFDAMNEYFQLVIEDNCVLKKKIEDQMVEISSVSDKAKLLSCDNKSLRTQQLLDQEIQSELEDKIRVQDTELGRLELKIECFVEEHLRDLEGKNSEIANLQAANHSHLHEIDLLAQNDERGLRHLVQTKNHEIARLNADLNKVREEKWELEQKEQDRLEKAVFDEMLVCYSDRESEEVKLRLGAADQELRELRRRLQEYEF